MLRPRRRQDFLINQRLCRRWARSYAYPGSMFLLPAENCKLPLPICHPRSNRKGRLDAPLYPKSLLTCQAQNAVPLKEPFAGPQWWVEGGNLGYAKARFSLCYSSFLRGHKSPPPGYGVSSGEAFHCRGKHCGGQVLTWALCGFQPPIRDRLAECA